jgi:hypothetical protein
MSFLWTRCPAYYVRRGWIVVAHYQGLDWENWLVRR